MLLILILASLLISCIDSYPFLPSTPKPIIFKPTRNQIKYIKCKGNLFRRKKCLKEFTPLCGIDSYEDELFGCLDYKTVENKELLLNEDVTQWKQSKRTSERWTIRCNDYARCRMVSGTAKAVVIALKKKYAP
ncbi:unnamed protein product [Danaus chrysippus]|uniref:(African queen) hypothetical protein n=1 Tax=Danaus chrysippus TaxID=151541 RepID=A0A8J2QE50_9NEOP|nr:unnamed protein product [Danaus chrysippus]